MKATLKINVSTDKNLPTEVSFSLYDDDHYYFSYGKKFTHKINSDTLFYDFLMTRLDFRVKENKIKHLDDFDLEIVFTLEIEVGKDSLKELLELQKKFLEIDPDSQEELYKWIKKALSEFSQQHISLQAVKCKD